jgi:hypothetical protein
MAEKTLAEVLTISDDEEFAQAIILYVLDKSIKHGSTSLSPIERTIKAANNCSYKILNGGFTDPLTNTSIEWCYEMLVALAEIGASNAERILRAGADLVAAVPDDAVKTIGDVIRLAGEEKLDALEREFDGCDGQGEIDGALVDYIVKNRSRFRSD